MPADTLKFLDLDGLSYFKGKLDTAYAQQFAGRSGTINGVVFTGDSAITVYDSTKLSSSDAAATYLTKTDAASTYLGIHATADDALKLKTAVKINGVDFDGSSAITIYDSTKLSTTDAASTYLSKTDAAATYLGINATAADATKLHTPVTINGVSFDGSSNITINAVDSTARIPLSDKGVAGGVATLDANGHVPASQLPSYVDDVIEGTSVNAFPETGESDKIYLATDTGNAYRWTGTQYLQINNNVSTADTAVALSPGATINGVLFTGASNITVYDNTKLSTTDAASTYLSQTDAASTYVAQVSGKGLSTEDFTTALKTKLEGIAAGANAYVLPKATGSTLGGVYIGSNIHLDDGTISITSADVIAALGFTPTNAATQTAVEALSNAEIDTAFAAVTSGS